MTNLNLSGTQWPHALLVKPRGAAEVAAFVTKSGDKLVCNANLNPYSPVDGAPMQVTSSKKATLSAKRLEKAFVSVGRCANCQNELVASASLADAIETAGKDFNCVFCSSPVTPSVNNRQLIHALAAEFDEDGDFDGDGIPDDQDPDDAGFEGDEDGESTDGDDFNEGGDGGFGDEDDVVDEDYPDDDGALDDDGDDDEEYDGNEFPDDDEDDEGYDEDDVTEEAPEDGDETAGVRAFLNRTKKAVAAAKMKPKKRVERANDENCDDAIEGDGQTDAGVSGDAGDASMDFAAAVAAVRKKMKELGMEGALDGDADSAVDFQDEMNDVDPGLDTESHGLESEFGDNPDVDPLASAAPDVPAAPAMAHRLGDRPIAGKPRDNDAIAAMNEQARAALRDRRGARFDGNAHLKGPKALAGDDNMQGDRTVGEQPITPGTNATEGEENNQEETPGSNRSAPPNPDTQEVTPGTNENSSRVSGAQIVDWKTEKVELVATSDADIRWVFASGKPVGTIAKAAAAAGVQAQWNNSAGLQRAFAALCARGLPDAEATEFGFRAHAFTVNTNEAMRKMMRNQTEASLRRARDEADRSVAAYKQSVKTALTAALKGTFADLKNPMRDALVASLAKLAVDEPRGVVDSAMAASVEPFLVEVFKKADELAGKTDEARNETANIVATASYQARVDHASALAAKLAKGSAAVAGAKVATEFATDYSAPAADAATDQASKVRAGVAAILSKRLGR
jgi:hypothetical protein